LSEGPDGTAGVVAFTRATGDMGVEADTGFTGSAGETGPIGQDGQVRVVCMYICLSVSSAVCCVHLTWA